MNKATTVNEACERFPEVFGLANFPGKRFSVSKADSYDSHGPEGILIYTAIEEEDGEWILFTKGTESELMKEVVVLEGHPLPIPVKTRRNGRVDFDDYVDWVTDEPIDVDGAERFWRFELEHSPEKIRSAALDYLVGQHRIEGAFDSGHYLPLRSIKITRILAGEEQKPRVICDPKRSMRQQTCWQWATLAEGQFKYRGKTCRAELRVEVAIVEGVEGELKLEWHLVEGE